MKKLLAVALIASVCATPGAFAAKDWDDMSWWGNTGATPLPVKDSPHRMEYTGYWWWPINPASNVDDMELWGNRGIVYHIWTPLAPEPPRVEPPMQPPQPVVIRSRPIFNNVLFDFDRSTLRPEGRVEIDKVIGYMNQFPQDTLLVEGHTDSIGTNEYNMGLGQRRADSVRNYMVENGVGTGRITAQSFGEESPAVPNDTPANRQLNRRAVFQITVNP